MRCLPVAAFLGACLAVSLTASAGALVPEDLAVEGALVLQPVAAPTPATLPAPASPARPVVEPANDPAFTGPADLVARAAALASRPGGLAPDELGLLAAEQQLRTSLEPARDLGWSLLRLDFRLPELPSAAVLVSPAHPAVPLPTSAAVVASSMASLVGALAPRLPAMPGYSRIEREEAMLNSRRSQLYEMVRAEPGIHLSDLVRRSGLGWGAALYHLSVLEKNRVLVAHAEGGFKRYFANGLHHRGEMARMTALRHVPARQLFEAVQSRPGLSGRELAMALGLSPSTLARASERLEHAGLVRRVREGRRMRYFPAEPAAPVLAIAA
jgi:DNA-binding transcriptional ArsR family regulator